MPEKGDFVVVTFDPQSGREQRGRRPALVVSNTLFNRHTGLAMVCPLTNTYRKVPFHVALPSESSLTGYVHVSSRSGLSTTAAATPRSWRKAPRLVLDEALSLSGRLPVRSGLRCRAGAYRFDDDGRGR